MGYELLVFGGSTGGGQGWGVQGYISLEPQLCAGLPEFSVPERCFKSVWCGFVNLIDLWVTGLRVYCCCCYCKGKEALEDSMV